MKHPLNVLLRVGRSAADYVSLLGDLEEERTARITRGNGRWAASAWYTVEVLCAFAHGLRDRVMRRTLQSASTQHLAPATSHLALRTIPSDVRYALRRWRHRPGFAVTAILMLGLGIAAATSIFSVVDAVLLKPLPWTNPELLVVIHGVYPGRRDNPATAPTWNRWYLSLPAVEALQHASSFAAVGAWWRDTISQTTIGDDRTEMITEIHASSTLLPTLGVTLSMGRDFNEMEDRSLSDSVILSNELWLRRFGGRRDIIGQRITIGSATFFEQLPKTVIGVIEPGFHFDHVQPDILLPIGRAYEGNWRSVWPDYRVIARLAPGVSLKTADAQAAAIVSAAPSSEPGTARAVPIADEQLGPSRRPLWLLFGAAGLLLLIACSNVAGLLFGEARIRRHEFAVRAALGGSRAELIRQLVIEYAVLAVVSGLVGLTCASWFTHLLVSLAPAGLPRIETTTLDLRATAFAVTTGFGTLLLFGVMPALALAGTPVTAVLADASRDGGVMRFTGQRLIVVAQIALALVLLTGATLFGETILRLQALPLGFAPDRIAVASTTFAGSHFGDIDKLRQAWKTAGPGASPSDMLHPMKLATTEARTAAVLQRLLAIPGVTHAAASSAVPFVENPKRIKISLDGDAEGRPIDVLRQTVTEGYFQTVSIRFVSGRDFTPADARGEAVAVISSEFERRFFDGRANGRRFNYIYNEQPRRSTPYRVIGVVDSVKRQDPTDDDRAAFYAYYRIFDEEPNHFVISSTGDPTRLLPAVRQAINDVSPQLIVTSTTTMASRVGLSVVEERFRATLSVIFGTAALALAAIGLYGLAARRVADRRREFGVRIALGAAPGDVHQLVIRDAMTVVIIGLAIGLPSSLLVAQISRGLLFGVTATSPHVFAGALGVLTIVVLLATILPARKAARVDPISALRQS